MTQAPRPRRAHWTPGKQRTFLAALIETGCVAYAAYAAGMSRSSANRLRQRLAGTPFDRLWDWAIEEHERRMADPLAKPASKRPHAAPEPRVAASDPAPG